MYRSAKMATIQTLIYNGIIEPLSTHTHTQNSVITEIPLEDVFVKEFYKQCYFKGWEMIKWIPINFFPF